MKDENFEGMNTMPDKDDVFEGGTPAGEESSIDWNERPAVRYTQNTDVQSVPPVKGSEPAGVRAGAPAGVQIPTESGGYPPQRSYRAPQQAPFNYNVYGQQPYPMQPKQKKKMSTPLVVFITLFSVLVVGSVMGLAIFGIYSFSTNAQTSAPPPVEQFPFGDNVPQPDSPFDVNPDEEIPNIPPDTKEPENSIPEFTNPDGESSKENQPEIVQPNIDIPENAKGMAISPKPKGNEMTPKEVYDKVLVSTVTIKADVPIGGGQTGSSVGTGIIISEDGFIITNSHVIGNTKSSGITVITSDGKEYPAVAVGFDKATDLAVIKTDDHNYTPAEIGDSSSLSIGDWVMAIGNPGGSSFSGSLTRGVVSGLERSVGYSNDKTMTYIQTDAAINPGNSGGPLVNMYGQVVGINTSKIVQEYYEGMGFAIPSAAAKGIVDELLSAGYVSGRVRLGITGSTVDAQTAMMYGCPPGIAIAAINDDSSFANSGAQAGDVITQVDGEAVDSLEALTAKFLNYKPGDKAEVTLYRLNENGGQGSEFKVKITLLEDKGETQK